jgi:poly-gamma-glutamate synthesis protein (capsule biosynthesis protein)
MEFYNEGVIFYSLGNFTFGSMSRSSYVSIIARVTLENGVKEVQLIPLNVLNSEVSFQPKVLHGERGFAAIRRLENLSRPLGVQIRSEKSKFVGLRDMAKQGIARY